MLRVLELTDHLKGRGVTVGLSDGADYSQSRYRRRRGDGVTSEFRGYSARGRKTTCEDLG
jgi:hypothetical protein